MTLTARTPLRVRDVEIHTDLDVDYNDARLRVDVQIRNDDTRPRSLAVQATLVDSQRRVVAQSSVTKEAVPAGVDTTVAIAQDVASPAKWSAERRPSTRSCSRCSTNAAA